MRDLLTGIVRRLLVGKDQQFVFRPERNFSPPPVPGIDLYVHIPFCKSLCPYCPYNRLPYDPEQARAYVQGLLQEISFYEEKWGRVEISSIYFGGGTPTNLIDHLGDILDRLRRSFLVRGSICLETIPSDLDAGTVRKLEDLGVDSLSLGVQSFQEKFLRSIGRNYGEREVYAALDLVSRASFRTLNLDLMFALPLQTPADLLADLQIVTGFGPDQVTAYPLFTFPYSSVGRHLRLSQVKMPGLLARRRMYRALHDFFTGRGYHRVSVWGFKRGEAPKYSSVTRHHYVGLGAGGCSRVAEVFYLNTFSVAAYLQAVHAGKFPVALKMDLTPALQRYYWLYWRIYETEINLPVLRQVFAKDRKAPRLLALARLLGFWQRRGEDLVFSKRGAFWTHLLQNYFVLEYINKVWSAAMADAWPENIAI